MADLNRDVWLSKAEFQCTCFSIFDTDGDERLSRQEYESGFVGGAGTKTLLDTGGVCKSASIPRQQELPKATVDALFSFSCPVALDYSGVWITDDTFQITVSKTFPILDGPEQNVIGLEKPVETTVPAVGCVSCVNAHEFQVVVLKEAGISNSPASCLAQAATSPPLQGDFGRSVVSIAYVIADDPRNVNDLYSAGDTITIVFSQATNMGGLPAENIPKEKIDALIQFSEHIGTQYVGNWRCGNSLRKLCKEYESSINSLGQVVTFSRWALEITILDITGVRGFELCADQISGCESMSLDMAGFTVTLLPEGPYPPHVWASHFSTGGPGLRNFPATCAASQSSFKGILGRFGRRVDLYSIQPSRLAAAGGYVTIAGRGFGWDQRIISVKVGERFATDITMPSGWTSPVPLLMPQTIVCLAPAGTGARGKVITIYLADEFSTDAFSASLNGLIFYAAPVVSAVVPARLKLAALQAFEETRYIITVSGLNFGVPSSARGRLPDENDGDPFPKVLIYTMTDGVHLCTNVSHVSDMTVMCVHTVSARMRTGSSALVVIDVDDQQSTRDSVAECSCQLNYQVVSLFPVVSCYRYTPYRHAYAYILLPHGHTSNPCQSHGSTYCPTASSV
jgi:hypothetical protein